jgi:hypothetical protein
LIALPGRMLASLTQITRIAFGIANAETAVVGDPLSQLCRNMRSNINKETSRIGLTGLAVYFVKNIYLLTRG